MSAGVLYAFKGHGQMLPARVRTPSSLVRETETKREREREEGREKKREGGERERDKE